MPEVTWQRGAECVGTQVEDAFVLLDLDGGMYYALNGPAADVWAALAEPSTEGSLSSGRSRKGGMSTWITLSR